MDLLAERAGGIGVTHDKDGRIVTGQTAHHIGNVHAIQRGGSGIGQTGHGLDHHDILGEVHADDALTEDGAQLVGHIQAVALNGNRIAIAALTDGLLDQMELLDIAGNSSLRANDAHLLQALLELFLGVNRLSIDDLKDLGLAVIFPVRFPLSFYFLKFHKCSYLSDASDPSNSGIG